VRRDPEAPVHLGKDHIEVNGAPLRPETKIYLVLNKPRGIVTTADDEKDRATVYSLLPEDLPWLAPIGRLDKASEGLLLLTNDSEWAAQVTAPETHLDKIYHVQIAALADVTLTQELQRGFTVADGELLRVKRAEILRTGEKNSWMEITLDEGRNRHLRRMFDHRGIEVLRLIRVAIGPLAIAELPKGATRALTPTEKLSIDRAIQRSREANA
jgi:23S rRNA pseudouridine2605 synthase